jgi:endonuclease-8
VPEGDTIHRTAATLHRALAGLTLDRLECRDVVLRAGALRHRAEGREIGPVEARGKHVLLWLGAHPGGGSAGRLVLHSHLGMTGAWHLYRPGERWGKAANRAVLVLHTAGWVAPCFGAPRAWLHTEAEHRRDPLLRSLGPDAAAATFDEEEAVLRLRVLDGTPIGVALLNQRVLAGVGNVYKSEVLFLCRVSPFATVASLEEERLVAVVREARRLLLLNLQRGVRRTHFALAEQERLWVYGRSGRPCRVCGAAVRMRRQGDEARSTYYCPRCQQVVE